MSKQVDNGLTRDLYTDLLYFQMILHSLPQSSIIWNQGQRAPQWWTWVTNHFSIDFKVFLGMHKNKNKKKKEKNIKVVKIILY